MAGGPERRKRVRFPWVALCRLMKLSKIILKEVCSDKKRNINFSYAATDNINESLDS
jgi:hypothetical protein